MERNEVTQLIHIAKAEYYKTVITENKPSTKRLFSVNQSLIKPRRKVSIQSSNVNEEKANDFAAFFLKKVEDICSALSAGEPSVMPLQYDPQFPGQTLKVLRHVTATEIDSLVEKAASKTCALDVLPTSVLKNCSKLFSRLRYSSFILQKSTCYSSHKKVTLDETLLNNFSPVSNLPFLA
ncbi:uncharacterized protein LOC124258910 [Haliotis rubra]|uniref:uncharacterized protein LOC124258910 n=1 Tax=Haliotis rubra TaxID=36100 RepID=UPI001EE63463|nr:uncharacterized protein LOC124258910 [Haliotis rubra]